MWNHLHSYIGGKRLCKDLQLKATALKHEIIFQESFSGSFSVWTRSNVGYGWVYCYLRGTETRKNKNLSYPIHVRVMRWYLTAQQIIFETTSSHSFWYRLRPKWSINVRKNSKSATFSFENGYLSIFKSSSKIYFASKNRLIRTKKVTNEVQELSNCIQTFITRAFSSACFY